MKKFKDLVFEDREMIMNTFKDLVFEDHEMKKIYDEMPITIKRMLGLVSMLDTRARMLFPNGHAISIITGKAAQTDEEHPYEAMIWTNNDESDVIGYLDEEGVTSLMIELQKRKKIEFTFGDKVHYISHNGATPENGVFKAKRNDEFSYIVYNYNDDIDNFANYTAEVTPNDNIFFGWI